MKIPTLFEYLDLRLAISREEARRKGYYYVEDLEEYWSKREF